MLKINQMESGEKSSATPANPAEIALIRRNLDGLTRRIRYLYS